MRNLVAVAGIKTGLHNGAETLEGIILEDLVSISEALSHALPTDRKNYLVIFLESSTS